MDNNSTTCEIISASERASELRKSFICVSDNLHQAMTESPLAIFIYVIVVFFIMFLVQRAASPGASTLNETKIRNKQEEKQNNKR